VNIGLGRVLASLPNGAVAIFDRDLRYVFAAGRGLEEVGLSSAGLIGKRLRDVFPAEAVHEVEPQYERAFNGEAVVFSIASFHRVYSVSAAPYESGDLIGPAYSPHVFIETAKGTIEFELAVLDAPQTSWSFMTLVRKGFFNGLQIHRVVPNFVVQDGDPRGDGEGGPGYTIRDELNERPFLRGTVGMALSWKDTGGSQFFITHSPQPHLDARYTAFGKVVNGMDVVDRIQQGDTIQRVRVWDGKTMQQLIPPGSGVRDPRSRN